MREPVVYLIACADRVKIGFSSDPASRVATISTSAPYECRLLGTILGSQDQERRLHELLAPHRRHGEWFEATGADVARLVSAVVAKEVTDAAAAIDLLGGTPHVKRQTFFGPLIDELGGISGLSAALGVPYETANAMKQRDSIGTRHLKALLDALKAIGSSFGAEEVVRLKIARNAANSEKRKAAA